MSSLVHVIVTERQSDGVFPAPFVKYSFQALSLNLIMPLYLTASSEEHVKLFLRDVISNLECGKFCKTNGPISATTK